VSIFFLPDIKQDSVDILLITGDAYIDHPSFGIAVISRVLENAGYSVCIASQPDYKNSEYLKQLPEVRLFIGITAGNLDSIVSNYTGNRNRRKEDVYSIDGEPDFLQGHRKRPDRAVITYTSYIKQRYKKIPVIIGGIEASLRRFAHYDYVQDKIRHSILLDSKADILVYGMGEKAILEIADNIKNNKSIIGIRGTAVSFGIGNIQNAGCNEDELKSLPSFSDIITNPGSLIDATIIVENNMIAEKSENLIQFDENKAVICFKPQTLPTEEEIDKIYSLNYRRNYPEYCEKVPAYRMIKDSVTSHRGCYGKCSFCAIASHQGPLISSRSKQSIIEEVKKISSDQVFSGTISDIGGPTANMWASYCKIGGCKDPSCLYPSICKNLVIKQKEYSELLKEAKMIKGVKNVFITSGLRYDMMLTDLSSAEYLIVNHTSGLLKVAPENTNEKVLKLMRKPSFKIFEEFIEFFNKVKKKNKLPYYILPYIIISHPGSSDETAREMAGTLLKYDISTKQYQDFTPTPGTLATAMYYAGCDADKKNINIPKHSSMNNPQRTIMENILKRKKK
jgi:uncharacterized radical SAM protein YgiQ